MKKALTVIALLVLSIFFVGCSDNDNNNNYYPYEDKYVSYIAVTDFNNGGKLMFINRQTLEYSFQRDAGPGAESVTYFTPTRYFYVGGNKYITSVYASKDTEDVRKHNINDSSLVTSSSDWLFASLDVGGFIYCYPDSAGSLGQESTLPLSLKGGEMACTLDGVYVVVSGVSSGTDMAVFTGKSTGLVGMISNAGDAGVAVNEHLDVYAVNTVTKRLNLIYPDTLQIYDSIDLGALGAVNPWGVAVGGGKVYVSDNSQQGKVLVFDYDLNYITTIDSVGTFSKRISGDPERELIYVSNEGDGYGNDASLTVIDPAYDSIRKKIGLNGRRPMGLSVMPWSR